MLYSYMYLYYVQGTSYKVALCTTYLLVHTCINSKLYKYKIYLYSTSYSYMLAASIYYTCMYIVLVQGTSMYIYICTRYDVQVLCTVHIIV